MGWGGGLCGLRDLMFVLCELSKNKISLNWLAACI